jgi:hypothetical protein
MFCRGSSGSGMGRRALTDEVESGVYMITSLRVL